MSSRSVVITLASLLSLACCDVSQAQLPTTVQLPSFSFFTYRGTVVVPDSGGAYLGGVKRSAAGVTRRGRGLGSGLGRQQSNSQATAHVKIIDLDEMDRQILGGSKAEFMARSGRGEVRASGRPAADPDAEGKALVRYARKSYREGKSSTAFDTYLMAMDVLSPNLRDLAAAEFQRTFGASAKQALRMRSLTR